MHAWLVVQVRMMARALAAWAVACAAVLLALLHAPIAAGATPLAGKEGLRAED